MTLSLAVQKNSLTTSCPRSALYFQAVLANRDRQSPTVRHISCSGWLQSARS